MAREMTRFIGYYVGFQFRNDPDKWIGLGEDMFSLESAESFKHARFVHARSLRSGRLALDEEKLRRLMRKFAQGELTRLDITTGDADSDWAKALSNGVGFHFNINPAEPFPSDPFWQRFGSAGSFMATFPIERFNEDRETEFQKHLLEIATRDFKELKPNWAFIHLGARYATPGSIGSDAVYQKTKDGVPLTSFDLDVTITDTALYKEYVKGAFWTNFLNPHHVSALGGAVSIRRTNPCQTIVELGGERLLLQVGPSPLAANRKDAAGDYQRLRAFLRPIMVETLEDKNRIEMETMGKERWEAIWEDVPKNKTLRKVLR